MQRQTINQSNIQWFFDNNTAYQELKQDIQNLHERTNNNDLVTFLNNIEKAPCFKDLYLEIGKAADTPLTIYLNEHKIKRKNIRQELGYAATYDQQAKFLLCAVTLDELIKPYLDAEIEEEQKAVRLFVMQSPSIAYLEYLTKLKTANAQDMVSMTASIQKIKEANTFDELLTVTEPIAAESYAKRAYTWINAGLFGGMHAFNNQLNLLRPEILKEQHQFNYSVPADMTTTAAQPTLSSQ